MPSDALPHLAVDVHHNGTSVTLRLTGEVDAATATRVDEAVDESVLDAASELSLDLGGISFLDSSGLRSLLQLREKSNAAGTTVSLAAASPVVVRLLELTGLTDQFPLTSA